MMGVSDSRTQAKMDYDKAKTKAFFNRLFATMFQVNNELFRFEEVKYLLSPNGMIYRGISTIPLNKIIGSEGRYQDFDYQFMPTQNHTRARWEGVDSARLDEMSLPPIEVYQIGEYYFVRDGNHRVSVAREKGQEFIDAEIVELFVRMDISEGTFSEKGLLIAESYRYFLDKTKIDQIVPNVSIELTHPWGYYRLLEHINTYKYLLGERTKRAPKWEDSVRHWYENSYLKIVKLIRNSKILERFSERTEGDLYIWVMDHWHFLKEKYGDMPFENALKDYADKFGQSRFVQFFRNLKDRIVNKLTGRK